MNTSPDIVQRLWEYIDGISTADEKSVIEQLLKNDAEWKAKYKELLEIQSLLKSSELDAPSMRFTQNVMDEISKLHIAPAAKKYINQKIIWGIGFFFIALILGFLVFGISQMDFSNGQPSGISKEIKGFDISRFFSNSWVNALMMVNILLGLILFDNYLNTKRRKFRKES
ncbi:MAG: hypothetical protein V9F46_12820 [Chitinophagaceae bacterium]